MSISAILGGVSGGANASLKPKKVCASLQEICINTIDRLGLWQNLLQKSPWGTIASSAKRSIITSFEPYQQLPRQLKPVLIEHELKKMNSPLSHPNESRVAASSQYRFEMFKDEVLYIFSDENNQIPIDSIEHLEDPKLFLEAIIKLTDAYPKLTTWGDDPRPSKDLLFSFADTVGYWEGMNALLQAGAKELVESDEESEDEFIIEI